MGEHVFGTVLFLLFVAVALGLGRLALGRAARGLDPAARVGVYGLVGFGFMGLLVYVMGLVKVSESVPVLFSMTIAIGASLVALRQSGRSLPSLRSLAFRPPRDLPSLLILGAIALAVLFALTGVLTPSTPLDWDSLAYHLAVPKIWIANGKIAPISFIHHSNFPASADALFLVGLGVGGQAGAKAFMLAAYGLGILSVFGLARARYGERAGWWAALGFAAVPMAMWEAGSAYIDLIHGLYAGLGLWLLADDSEDRPHWLLPAILLGFALGTKYTGLQALVVGGVLAIVGARRPEAVRIAGVALLVGGFWYVKNVLWTGNPVYPFYYSLFGGRNWDAFSAAIYAEEQATFGMGKGPGAWLGLAAVPGRFTNPDPGRGLGFIFVSLGASGLASLAGWAFAPRVPRLERRAVLACGLMLALWLFASEQSRYILAILPILAILGGGLAARASVWKAIVGVNAALGLFVFSRTLLPDRLPFLSGGLTEAEYLGGFAREDGSRVPGRVPFYEPAQYLNTVARGGRVALYDEVFGSLLDVPYLWANPGHSTELGYAGMTTGDDLANALRREGVTHVYLAFIGDMADPGNARFAEALGLSGTSGGPARPYTPGEVAAMSDLRLRWKALFADAVARGRFAPDRSFGRKMIYRLQ